VKKLRVVVCFPLLLFLVPACFLGMVVGRLVIFLIQTMFVILGDDDDDDEEQKMRKLSWLRLVAAANGVCKECAVRRMRGEP
jgi:hypothetical protein